MKQVKDDPETPEIDYSGSSCVPMISIILLSISFIFLLLLGCFVAYNLHKYWDIPLTFNLKVQSGWPMFVCAIFSYVFGMYGLKILAFMNSKTNPVIKAPDFYRLHRSTKILWIVVILLIIYCVAKELFLN